MTEPEPAAADRTADDDHAVGVEDHAFLARLADRRGELPGAEAVRSGVRAPRQRPPPR